MAIPGKIQQKGGAGVSQAVRVPAPFRGLDTRIALASDSQNHCIYTYNLMPSDYGMAVRKGYREWQIEVDNGATTGVNTLIPYDAVETAGTADKLFCANNEGIWDVTVAEAAPVLKVAFGTTTAGAGQGVYVQYVDNTGVALMWYADAVNGLYKYVASTTTWAAATGITGPTIADIRFVMIHKQRLWFLTEDSASSWYLAVGAVAGAATEFFLGNKYKTGGNTAGLFSWSVDGGAGVDDKFVAVSRSGDVLVYEGDDPATASAWNLRGTYQIGQVPVGGKFGAELGGELYLLSATGIVGMNGLLQGVNSIERPESTPAAKITSILRARMKTTRDDYGWAIRLIPSQGGMLVSTPTPASSRPIQFFYDISVDGWGMWRDVPITAFDSWNDNVVFADADSRILYMDRTRDNILITPVSADLNGDPIEFSTLTGFSSLGADGVFKRVKLIRPDFISGARPTFFTQARYDYTQTELAPVLGGLPPLVGVWDSGEWDASIWVDGDESFNVPFGSWGVGRYVAVAMKGYSYEPTQFIGWDVIFDAGGMML